MSTNNEIQTGLVGWFDVLGYKEFLDSNNDLAYCIKVIQEVIAEAEQEVIGEFKNNIIAHVPPDMQEEKTVLLEVQHHTKWVVFADTVLLTLPVQAEAIWKARLRIATFLHLTKSLFIRFLGAGLPVRAAISFGTFYVHAHPPLFAGKPLVQAQQWAEKQKWTGCVLTPNAASVFNQILAESDPDNRKLLASYVVRYFTSAILPDSVTTKKTMLCLNWPKKIGGFQTEAELPMLIERQFKRHSKQIDRNDVQTKIKNTVEFALHCRKTTTVP
ncbi:MAG: hypothetical protein ABSA97_10895 [Verrucomicrobiia bacterium]